LLLDGVLVCAWWCVQDEEKYDNYNSTDGKITVEAPAPGYIGCERSSKDGTADGGDTENRAEYSLEHGALVEWDREHHDDYTSAEDPGCSKTGDCSSNDESFRVGCRTTNCGLQGRSVNFLVENNDRLTPTSKIAIAHNKTNFGE